jgi:ADP-ribose pyrophosphatase YjhB (NUDIX family)
MSDPAPPLRVPALFRHCPRCGHGPSEPGPAPHFTCVACGFHYHFNPAVAAGVLVADSSGRVLFLRRDREPAKGRLGVPGGFVELGESAEAAAAREAREETGLEVEDLAFLGSWPNLYEFRGVVYSVVDLYFTGRTPDARAARPLHEAAEVLWRRPEDVDPAHLAFPTTRAAVARLVERRARPPRD